MNNPIELGNIILIIVGIVLIFSGPYITYRTVKGVMNARKQDSKASMHVISNGINLIIAVLLSMAGVLFVINNLRGNPLH